MGAGLGRPSDGRHLCPRSQPRCQRSPSETQSSDRKDPSVAARWRRPRPAGSYAALHHSNGCRSLVAGPAVGILGLGPLGLGYFRTLDRYGVVTRGSVLTENAEGGFGTAYRALSSLEESGQCRRGYFVEGLGAAQFALTGAVDRLRSHQREPAEPDAVVLAACDPANPYGAALPWPDREGHRPGRKAGALVVLVGGALIFYVERGGRTLLSFTEDPTRLAPAAAALARSVQQGLLGKLTVERADGGHIFGSVHVSEALQHAGFRMTPKGCDCGQASAARCHEDFEMPTAVGLWGRVVVIGRPSPTSTR